MPLLVPPLLATLLSSPLTLAVLGSVFGRRLLVCYLALMLTGALVWGYAYPFQSPELEVDAGARYAPLLAP